MGREKKASVAKILIAIIVIAIIALILGKNSKKNVVKLDAETLRAMQYEQLSEEDEYADENKYVKFSAFFARDLDSDGKAEHLNGTCKEQNETDTLFINIGVLANGRLEDGEITISSGNFSNKMNMVAGTQSVLKNNCIGDNVKTIKLKTVEAGKQELLSSIISSYIKSESDYSNVTYIKLTGTHIDDEGNITKINKSVPITVDWYGEAKTEISGSNNTYKFDDVIDSEHLIFNINMQAKTTNLLVKERHIVVDMPDLYGYYPEQVICAGGEYDESTHQIKIDEYTDSVTSDFVIKVIWPAEMYNNLKSEIDQRATKNIFFDVSGYSICCNNDNPQFDNPFKTDEVNSSILVTINNSEQVENIAHEVGMNLLTSENVGEGKIGWKKSHFLDAYNEENPDSFEYKVTYQVKRTATFSGNETDYTVTDGTAEEDILKIGKYEINDENLIVVDGKFVILDDEPTKSIKIKNYYSRSTYVIDCTGDTLGNYSANNFSRTKGIAFNNYSALEADGYVRIYDNETLIKEFTYDELAEYGKDNPYMFSEDVANIKIETSEDKNKELGYFIVDVIKEIDTKKLTENIDRAELIKLTQFKTNVTFSGSAINNRLATSAWRDVYMDKSMAGIFINPADMSIGTVDQNTVINIKVPNYSQVEATTSALWADGTFLVKIPKKQINNLNVKSVTSSNNTIEIDGYGVSEDDEYYIIKIYTKNTGTETIENDDGSIDTQIKAENGFDINISADMSIYPITSPSQERISLWAYNKKCELYTNEAKDVYDLDGDGSVDDYVGYYSSTFQIKAPTTFVSTESISNYNEEDDITYSPNVADVTNTTRKASVDVFFMDNYQNTLKNLEILGKIPFEGNTYTGDKSKSLKSTYSTTMTSEGLNIPDDLKDFTTIYYSENEDPTKDIDDSSNGWKTKNEIDMTKVKTYLVIINSEKVVKGKTYKFSYNIEIPEDIGPNNASYACHTAYFTLGTTGGNIDLFVQPAKVGVRITKYFNLDLKKLKENTEHGVDGATYLLTEEDENGDEANQRYIESEYDGSLRVDNLRINQIYYLVELRAENYEVNNSTIKFRVTEGDNGDVGFEYLDNTEMTFDGDVSFSYTEDGRPILTSTLEDVPKVRFKVRKIDSATKQPIKNVSFSLNDGLVATTYKTDNDGYIEAIISLDKKYTLKEISATGYFMVDPIEFTIKKNGNQTSMLVDNKVFDGATINNPVDGDLVESTLEIENEPIPTFDLQIQKVSEGSGKNLEGIKFLLERDDFGKSAYYTTDKDGIINIKNLYQFVEGKSVVGNYTIKEVETKKGYILDETPIEFKVSEGNDGKLIVTFKDTDKLQNIRGVETDASTVKMKIANKPLFKLLKLDSKTNEPIANVEFVIYSVVNENEEYAKDIDGEFVGTQNSNGDYIVKTDGDGVIQVALPSGKYKIVEYSTPEGYEEKAISESFIIKDNSTEVRIGIEDVELSSNTEIIEVNYIDDLVTLSELVNNGDNRANTIYRLQRDLNFKDPDSYKDKDLMNTLTDEGGSGFTPIGRYGIAANHDGIPFSGIFDGQNHRIDNMYMKVTEDSSQSSTPTPRNLYAGLFGNVSGAEIKNLTLSGKIEAINSYSVAGIVASGTGIVENCHSEVEIHVVINKGSNPIISGVSNASGVTNCTNKGNITIEDKTISGYRISVYGVSGGSAINSYNTGDLSVSMIGESEARIWGVSSKATNCFNRGNILIESNETSTKKSTIYIVSGDNENCYSTGDVSIKNLTNYEVYAFGYGYMVENSYYREDTAIPSTGVKRGGTAISDSNMKLQSFVESLGSDNWSMDTENINAGYPIPKFYVDPITEEIELEEKNVEINCIEDLVDLSNEVESSYPPKKYNVKLNKSLDFESDDSYENVNDTSYGYTDSDGNLIGIKEALTSREYDGFKPIGCYKYKNIDGYGSTYYGEFIGIFDGQGKIISNLYINGDTSGLGLFGYVKDAEIKDITVTGEIDGNASYIGGICGTAIGNCLFENCINNCNIKATSENRVGGIVGQIGQYGRITRNNKVVFKSCKNYGTISGGYAVGGMFGYTERDTGLSYIIGVHDCHNYGNINSNDSSSQTGGLVGYTNGKVCYINNCHNHADVSGKAWAIGGILGDSEGKVYINKCSNEGKISGEASGQIMIGGLVGDSNESTDAGGNFIYNSKNTGIVTGNIKDSTWGTTGYIGGLIGRNSEYNIVGCTNSGKINATNIRSIGGLVGQQKENSIHHSNNTGDINSNASDSIFIGGIVGNTYDTSSIFECYNTGNIVSEGATYEFVGGIVGSSDEGTSISYTHNKGNITTSEDINSTSYWGGIVGNNKGSISYSYNLGSITSNLKSSSTTFYGGIAGNSSSVAYSYNKGIIGISIDADSLQTYVGGIVGQSNGSVYASYNTAPITVSTNMLSTTSSYGSESWIGGIVGSGKSIQCCYNTGNITNQSISNRSPEVYLGGVAGKTEVVAVSYNTGNIKNTTSGSNPYSDSNYYGTNIKVGGVVGHTESVTNVYNLGEVQNFSEASTGSATDYYQVGGISGYTKTNAISYNIGSVYNNVVNVKDNTLVKVGAISGESSATGAYNIYLENIDVVGNDYNNSSITTAETEEYMKSLSISKVLGTENWKYKNNQYPTLEFPVYIGEDEDYTEITVENTPLKFDITTEIAENKEGRRSGGSITGIRNEKYAGINDTKKFIEEVEYNGSSTKEIVAVPSEGYQVVSINIGGNNYVFNTDENGNVTIPAGYIKNVKADCNVLVKFEKIEDTITIRKVNKNGENLEGAEFSIEQVDLREQPEQSRISKLYPAGIMYSNPDTNKKVDGVLGDIQQGEGDYGFELQEDGTYIPNNTVGGSATATSYFKIDLTGKEGINYYATLNIKFEQSSYTYFYMTESTDRPTGSAYKTVYSSSSAGNIVSTRLLGGKTYYLHIISSSSATTPSVVISDVNVYEEKAEQYNFEEINGKYVSTNQGHNNRVCRSTININTTELEGKYKLIINAELSSQEGVDFGNLSIGDGKSAPKDIADITGKVNAKDYEYTIDGGSMYYMYMSYSNGNVDTDNGTDTFTINSIRLELDKSEYYYEDGVLTNNKGEILRSLNYGTYRITETKAPEGYILDSTPRTLVVGEDTDNIIEIENEKGAEVIAHYYVYGTGKEFNKKPVMLSSDVTSYGKVGEEYTTKPILEINEYKLIKENGEYAVPENATGSYEDETTDVYYYYEKEKTDGTFKIEATKVSLENNEEYIEGAEFSVYKVDGENKEKIGTIKSVGNGKYESEDIRIEKEGILTIEIDETTIPEGYEPIEPITMELTIEVDEDTATYVVTKTSIGKVNDAELKTDKKNKICLTIEEPEIKETYRLVATKVDEENTEEKVTGAEFEVYEEGTKVATLTDENEDGIYESGDIAISEAGTKNITIKETVVPPGYVKADNITGTITFGLSENGGEYVITETTLGDISEDGIEISFEIVEKKDEQEEHNRYDLAIKKFVSAIDNENKDSRAPKAEMAEDGTITYIQNNEIEQASNNQEVTYTLRVYNESSVTAKGKRIIEYIPDGLVFLPENAKNIKYEWEMYARDENGKLYKTTNQEEAKVVVTDHLVDKEISASNDKDIKSIDVEVVFKVDESKITSKDRIIENRVSIRTDNDDNPDSDDDDSPSDHEDPDNNPDNDETTEKLYVKYFDLSMEKYIKQVVVENKNGRKTLNVSKENQKDLKVEVNRSELDSTIMTITYVLNVKNVGEIEGYADEITEYIPNDFELVDSEGIWRVNGSVATTSSLKDTLLYPGDTKVIEVTFTWKLTEDNVGARENEAKITKYSNPYDAEDPTADNDDSSKIDVEIINDKYNLAIKKFISAIDENKLETRIPLVEIAEDGTIIYKQSNEIEKISNSQTATYTLRMYNESDITAKGKKVIEYIPDGLVFLPENDKNIKYGWVMYKADENGKLSKTNNPEEAAIVVTDYLVDKEIKAFNKDTNSDISYLDVEVVFEVNESKLTSDDRIIENKVQIMPNDNDDYPENDESTEKLYVKYFDLGITKYIEEVKVKNNKGETTQQVGESKKGELVKIDVKESDAKDTTIIVTYGLIVKNIGEIPGYATEVVDYIPQDFKLVEDGIWSLNENKAVTTSLKNTLLEPGESTTLKVTFEWNLADGNIGSRTNEAEIASYTNEYNAVDLTEDNKDKEEMLVTIKTGSEIIMYVVIGLGFIAVIGVGVIIIKKRIIDIR